MDMHGSGYFLTRNANCFGKRTALVSGNSSLTYEELNLRVNCFANNLLATGVKKGDRVGYLFPNCVELIVIWFATQKIGAVAVPINVRLLSGEVKRIVEFAECKVFAYHHFFQKTVGQIKEKIKGLETVICYGEDIFHGEYDFTSLCEKGEKSEPGVHISGDDLSIIMFTSGTTGVSKGVVRTHRVIWDYASMMMIENQGTYRHEVLLTHCPLFHTAGMGLLMKIIALGGTLIIVNRVEPREILEAIETRKVTQVLLLPPIMYRRLFETKDWENFDLTSVKEAQSSGGKFSLEIALMLFKLFPNCKIKVSYGSTETCAPTSVLMTKDEIMENPKRILSVGKLNSLVEMRLCDELGLDVPQGEVGEACVRSSMVMKEYLKEPELTKEAFVNGWFRTEDMLKQDEDGYYYLVDRKKDMVKTGGENVYAQEVEDVLNTHPAIRECAVIGIPDKHYGEAVAVAIVLEEGSTLKIEEVVDFCKQHLASYKKPRYVAFLDELPRNSLGKVQKTNLREKYKGIFRPAF